MDGYSLGAFGVLAATGPTWVVLGVEAGAPWAVASSIVWWVGHILLCAKVAQLHPVAWPRMLPAAGIAAAAYGMAAAIGAVLGTWVLGLVAANTCMDLVHGLPALRAALRAPTTRGLSLLTIVVNLAEGGAYLATGLGAGLFSPPGQIVAAYVSFGCIALLLYTPRLVRVTYRRLRHLDDTPTAAMPA